MKTYYAVITLLIILLLPLSSHANTFCVSDATGLQTALTTASGNGEDDTVQIMQGTYVGSFIYASTEAFNLTVEGGYTSSCSSRVIDPTNTVLDASGLETVLVLTTTQSVDFAVDGITLRNGLTAYSDHGGGLNVNTPSGDIILMSCVLDNNQANQAGGGAYLHASTVTITNSHFSNNIAGDDGGGAFISANQGIATITNNTFYNNSAYTGGGIRFNGCDEVMLIGNIFDNNTAAATGGVWVDVNISATITNNMITNNIAERFFCGGILLSGDATSTITMQGNTINNNTAQTEEGGGIYANSSNLTIDRNIITQNAGLKGGGLYSNSRTTNIVNNVICNNTATNEGGGVWVLNDTINMTNNTISKNTRYHEKRE